MTYHLWHNGTDTGPYTRDEITKRHARGELVGILWRRTGDTQFLPHTDLDDELTPTPPEASGARSRERTERLTAAAIERLEERSEYIEDPASSSLAGTLLVVAGGIVMGIGVFALATGAMAAGDLIGSGIGLIALGKIFAIDAKVKFLAHRLRR